MENHKEKIVIFDNYAKEKGYDSWLDLEYQFIAYPSVENDITQHIYNVCDLVQSVALKRASENIKTVVPEDFTGNLEYISSEIKAFKHSISSEKNLVK